MQHAPSRPRLAATWLAAAALVFAVYRGGAPGEHWTSMRVTASAYNATPGQTNPEHPTLAAWGDTLHPGMRAIAVSRDLIGLGLTHGTRVAIEGLSGTYVVRDKMHRRWRRRIDIYMTDPETAREWGLRTVTIRWRVGNTSGYWLSGRPAAALR